MKEFKEVAIKDFIINPFYCIGKDWMLVTAAKKDGSVNALTAAWGGLGWLWERPVAFVFIRESRYTKEFIEDSHRLSLSFPPSRYRKELGYMGSVSGRDEDKIAHCGLTLASRDGIPYFEEADTVFLGHDIYAQDIDPIRFLDHTIIDGCYQNNDYHTLYVTEIDTILTAR
jgi:flavin reductase (DIM6/NTAB) family NADH-FMN oxidoreductase RutF